MAEAKDSPAHFFWGRLAGKKGGGSSQLQVNLLWKEPLFFFERKGAESPPNATAIVSLERCESRGIPPVDSFHSLS